MTDTPTGSGVDMARAALAAARAAAKTKPATTDRRARKRRAQTTPGGRDPIGLAAAIGGMMAERGWEQPAAGSSIVDQWPLIAPELAKHDKVVAVRFDPATGTLHLQPCSPAYATQLRLLEPQVVRRIREKTGTAVVRRLRILPPSSSTLQRPEPTEASAMPDRAAAVSAVSAEVLDVYQEGAKAARAAMIRRTPQPADQAVAASVARQDQALKERREPAADFRDGTWEADWVTQLTGDRSEEVRRAALTRKHREATGALPQRAFDAA